MPPLDAGPTAASNSAGAAAVSPPAAASAADYADKLPADATVPVNAIDSFIKDKLKATAYYRPNKGIKPNVLFAMCIGITGDDDVDVIDPSNDEVISKIFGKGKEYTKRDVVPANHLVVLKKEGRRRAIVDGRSIPTNANWKGPALMQHLLDNPPSTEEERHCLALATAFKESKKTEQLLGLGG